ncbi:hypothetical protein G6F57_021804 [Rhizopus arrhizus]|nr:hypothetical protein G6F57_021804 [Rhizopus arrhizus]
MDAWRGHVAAQGRSPGAGPPGCRRRDRRSPGRVMGAGGAPAGTPTGAGSRIPRQVPHARISGRRPAGAVERSDLGVGRLAPLCRRIADQANSHNCSIAQPPTNSAGPVERAGFTDVFVTGMLIK